MKKLLSIFSVSTLISIFNFNIISCKENINLTLKQQEVDIINAINLKNNLNNNNLKISDISNWNNPKCKNIGNNTFQINYDILVKQNLNTFLNKNYRISEVKGEFNIDSSNKIKEINYNPIYLSGNYYRLLNNSISSILLGNTNDFTLIMNKDKWWSFKSAIDNNNVSDYLKNISIYNSNIILESIDWRNIMLKIVNLPNPVVTIANGYAACIHIIRKPGQDFQIAYTNLNVNNCKNMPLSDNMPWLPLFSFQSSNDNYDGIEFRNNKDIILNKDILLELNDIYISYKSKESYGENNWNTNSISTILSKNKFCYDAKNLSYNLISKLLMSLFNNNKNYNEIKNLLSLKNIYGGIKITFDKNNNYLQDKLINDIYSNDKDSATRYIQDHYNIKQLLSTFPSGKGYYVEYLNFKGQALGKYVIFNSLNSFNDYENNSIDVLRYFYLIHPDRKIISINQMTDIKWEIKYLDINNNSQNIYYEYNQNNAIFNEIN